MKMLKFWFPVLIYSVMIFGVSSLQGTGAKPLFSGFDKLIHIVEYAPYGCLIARALENTVFNGHSRKVLVWTMVLVLCYGVSDEIHQYFVPGRTMDIFDVLADVLGGTLGCVLYIKFKINKINNS